jgi:WhiB family transcriptional regulator, redox-sensing transcriptional regulator
VATVEIVLKHWKDHAACRGMPIDLFVHRLGERQIVKRIKEAKAVCAGCLVQPECLDEALQYTAQDQDCAGIWGGLTLNERKQLISDTPMVYRDGKYRQVKGPRP